MNRAAVIEALARQIARRKVGNEDAWMICISEASQQVTIAAIKQRGQ